MKYSYYRPPYFFKHYTTIEFCNFTPPRIYLVILRTPLTSQYNRKTFNFILSFHTLSSQQCIIENNFTSLTTTCLSLYIIFQGTHLINYIFSYSLVRRIWTFILNYIRYQGFLGRKTLHQNQSIGKFITFFFKLWEILITLFHLKKMIFSGENANHWKIWTTLFLL